MFHLSHYTFREAGADVSDTENERQNKEKQAPEGKREVLKAETEDIRDRRDPKIEINQERIKFFETEGEKFP